MTILEHFLSSTSAPEPRVSLEAELWEKVALAYDKADQKAMYRYPFKWILGLGVTATIAAVFVVHVTVFSPRNVNNAKLAQLDQEAASLETQLPQDMHQDPAFAEIVSTNE